MSEASLKLVESELQTDPKARPKPVGWRVLVEPIKVDDMTRGGIALPSQSIEAKEHLNYVGRVVDMGALCYQHAKFEGGEPWCAVGDLVAFGQYAGQTMTTANKDRNGYIKMKMLNDDEILAVIPSVDSIMVYV